MSNWIIFLSLIIVFDSTVLYSHYGLYMYVHGDAAFSGQGINQETLAMSRVPHFDVGGSIHLIVNNQLGFTTPGERGRSSRYSSDLAKMINAPVLHVNGDYPEMVVKATRIAFDYQRKFYKDVFIDLNCYRRWGHNEVDDPTFTNPAVYTIINSRRSVPVEYASSLSDSGIFPSSESVKVTQNHTNWLNSILKSMDENELQVNLFGGRWSGIIQPDSTVTTWDTGVDLLLLQHIGLKSVSYPESFNIHPHLKKLHIKNRIERLTDGTNLDWSTAESLAIGSLLYQGFNVRISGQDVGRGTFSHRHVMLIDQVTNEMYIPLNNIYEPQMGYLEVANSILSEEAVLGFEYGMSIENPKRLVIWEAQFGDFMNGAQIQIDTFISSGETKWMTCSGIVMLLPHGYDGAGPEHSSCRMERFLQLSDSKEHLPDGDDVNMHLVYPTTPAQYFHVLRGQVIKNFRKPLVVVAPKILLRMPEAISSFSDMEPQTTFLPVIGDKYVDSSNVQKVIFVSGKHFYELDKYRKENSIKDVAIVRLEGLCPFPTFYLQQELSKYKKAKSFIWSQEEPQNMGAWSFVFPRFLNQVGVKLCYVGRPALAAPAVGIGKRHQKESSDVITQPFNKK